MRQISGAGNGWKQTTRQLNKVPCFSASQSIFILEAEEGKQLMFFFLQSWIPVCWKQTQKRTGDKKTVRYHASASSTDFRKEWCYTYVFGRTFLGDTIIRRPTLHMRVIAWFIIFSIWGGDSILRPNESGVTNRLIFGPIRFSPPRLLVAITSTQPALVSFNIFRFGSMEY